MLRLPKSIQDAIFSHACEIYPLECCGILIGRREGSAKIVVEARRAANLNKDRARDRYLLDPKDQLQAEKDARALDLEVIGYYHSHPDHPAEASPTDVSLAWEGYSYMIVSVVKGQVEKAASFYTDATLRAAEMPRMSSEPLEIF